MPGQVRVDHLGDHVGQADLGGPAELLVGLGGVAEQHVDFGRAHEARIDLHFLFVVQADMVEGELAEVADAVRPAGGDHVVVAGLLLQHQVHGADVVAGVTPVALGIEVAEGEMVGQAELDAGDAVGDLAGDELDAAQRALVIEQDAAAGVQAEALAVVHRHPVGVELGDTVGAAWVERGALGLPGLLDQAEHLRRGGLVELGFRPDEAHGLEHIAGAERGDGAGQDRLLPGGGDEALGGEVVDLVRLDVAQDADEAGDIDEVAVDEFDLIEDAEPAQALADHVRRGGAAHEADDAIAFAEQELREIGAVLSGDAGDECCWH